MNTIPKTELISIILPAYNEAKALPKVIASIAAVLRTEPVRAEFIVVDDGSTDGLRETMQILRREIPDIRYLRFSRNFGKEAALTAGLNAANGDAVIMMDSDGQHPPALVKTFLERWRSGYEIVCGVQEARSETALKRMFKSSYYRILEAGSPVSIPPNAGDFRLLDRKVVEAINRLPERNRYMKGLYAWVGFKTILVPFQAEARVAGTTKFGWWSLFGLAFTGMTSFTVVPLRLVTFAGLLVSFTSLIYGMYLLFEHFVDGAHLPGWATLAVGMMFLSGLQLLALGIIAEYLGRTLSEVKQRPVYILAEDTGSPFGHRATHTFRSVEQNATDYNASDSKTFEQAPTTAHQ